MFLPKNSIASIIVYKHNIFVLFTCNPGDSIIKEWHLCNLQNIQNYNAQLVWMHKDKWVPIWCLNRSVIHVQLFSGTKFITDCIIFMLALIFIVFFNIQVLFRLLLSLIVCKISYVSYFINMQYFLCMYDFVLCR